MNGNTGFRILLTTGNQRQNNYLQDKNNTEQTANHLSRTFVLFDTCLPSIACYRMTLGHQRVFREGVGFSFARKVKAFSSEISEYQPLNAPLRWPIFLINSDDNTKHWYSTPFLGHILAI